MKDTKKNIITAIVGGALVVSLMSPLVANADNATSSSATSTATSTKHERGESFCANVDKLASETDKKFAENEAKRIQNKNEKESKNESKRADKEKKLDDKRADSDQKRIDRLAKISSKATTTAQIAAVDTYKTAIQTAINNRRTAVDTAMKAYQSGLKSLIDSRKASSTVARTNLNNAINSAISKAKTDCASGVSDNTARTNFKNAVKAAKDQFNSAVKGLDNLKTQREALEKTRKSAFEKAHTDFKVAMENALSTLKTALGK